MSAIAIIPARGGSRRIPRKNIKLFHGKPIVAYAIEAARRAGLFDRVVVSTEDTEIKEVAMRYGATWTERPPRLLEDDRGPVDVARDLALTLPLDYFCVIYATAAMLDLEAMKLGLRQLETRAFALSVGVEPLHDAAQFVWCRREALLSRVHEFGPDTAMIMVDPRTDCDINTPEDWARAERMWQELNESCEHNYQLVTPAEPGEPYFRCSKCHKALPT